MSTGEILTLVNICMTAVSMSILYFNYRHTREKDFHDNIYKLKLDSYKKIIAQCHNAYKTLDINSTPFAQLYDIKDTQEWRKYYEQSITPLFRIGFDIRDIIYTDTVFLPSHVMDETFKFSDNCLQFVTICAHQNSEYIINKQDELHDLYFNVVNTIRADLGIEIIDDSLKARINMLTN